MTWYSILIQHIFSQNLSFWKNILWKREKRLWASCAAAKPRAFFFPVAIFNSYVTILITSCLGNVIWTNITTLYTDITLYVPMKFELTDIIKQVL